MGALKRKKIRLESIVRYEVIFTLHPRLSGSRLLFLVLAWLDVPIALITLYDIFTFFHKLILTDRESCCQQKAYQHSSATLHFWKVWFLKNCVFHVKSKRKNIFQVANWQILNSNTLWWIANVLQSCNKSFVAWHRLCVALRHSWWKLWKPCYFWRV